MAKPKDEPLGGGIYTRRRKRGKFTQVTTLYDTNYRNVSGMLRKLARDINDGKYGEVDQAVLVLCNGDVSSIMMGPAADGATSHLLLTLAVHKLEQQTLAEMKKISATPKGAA